MKTCDNHDVVYVEQRGRDRLNCPVCEAEKEIKRHEITNEELREQIAALTANLDRMRKNRDGLEQDWYALESGAHKAAEQIAALTCERDRLLYTVKMAYRKHHLDDPSTGWEELSTMLLTTLCENMGDEGFNEWLTAQKEAQDE